MKIIHHIRRRAMRLYVKARSFYRYCSDGVWTDMRSTPVVKCIKILNLSVRTFFNGDIQTKACALTYRTILAIVPALAIMLAIGRGFGLQDTLEAELIDKFSTQREALVKAFDFVDSYLSQSSGGIFVGIGIALLLWTLISILGSVEHAFNDIWGVKNGRSFWRKLTDYLAIFLILPVLMICANGAAVFVSTNIKQVLPFDFSMPLIKWMIDLASVIMVWLFFTAVYILVPNTKVKFKNALVAGIFAGTGFLILQWLFISGQIYVSRYNAIYGSFAFLPLLLIWIQLVWVICLAGGVICYASQNIFHYNFSNEIKSISVSYRLKILIALTTVIVKDYLSGKRPPSVDEIVARNGMPSRLVASSVRFMTEAGLLLRVINDEKKEIYGYVPAIDAQSLTVGDIISRIRNHGSADFIPNFKSSFAGVVNVADKAELALFEAMSDTYVKDIALGDLACDTPDASRQN